MRLIIVTLSRMDATAELHASEVVAHMWKHAGDDGSVQHIHAVHCDGRMEIGMWILAPSATIASGIAFGITSRMLIHEQYFGGWVIDEMP